MLPHVLERSRRLPREISEHAMVVAVASLHYGDLAVGADAGPCNAPAEGVFADLGRGRRVGGASQNGLALRSSSMRNESHQRRIVFQREEEAA